MSQTSVVWIDQDECMGAGTCGEIAPEVFVPIGDGLWGVAETAPYFEVPVVFNGGSGPGEGLDIARKTAESAGGSIIVGHSPSGGASIELTFAIG